MLIDTQGFWNYIVNEPEVKVQDIIKVLTRKDWNFDDKKYDISNYYQVVSYLKLDQKDFFGNNITDYVIRFPRGLSKWLTGKINFEVEIHDRHLDIYTEKDVLACANQIHALDPSFEVRDYQIEAALTSLNNFQSLIVSGVGSGKGQPVDLKIPTPCGFRKFGEIHVGDKVFGRNGKETNVIGVFPQGEKDIYKFKFSSGQETICDISHLWTFTNINETKTDIK